jgi:flagellum-specific ATP synthase
VLSRQLAHAGHYPAVDVLASVSRLVGEITSPETRAAANEVRKLMATYKEKSDLIAIGAYQPGSDPQIDAAVTARGPIDGFLRQGVTEPSTAEGADETLAQLAQLGGTFIAPVLDGQLVDAHTAAGAVGSTEGGMPLHSAIPPLHISS